MTRVLFICLGNICRSPAAEGILRAKAHAAGADVFVDSAGTGGWHAGESPDDRMIEHAKRRSYDIENLVCRQIDPKKDFTDFDLILTMDDSNFSDVTALDKKNEYRHKIRKTISFCKIHDVREVPDPYHQGDDGFELVLDILEDACAGLLQQIQKGK